MNFQVTQKIVCIKSHSLDFYKKGKTYTLQGIRSWKCGCDNRILLDVGLTNNNDCKHYCTSCNKGSFDSKTIWANSLHFVPTLDSSYVEHKFENIKEPQLN